MQAVATTDSLIPISSYTLYKDLLKELEDVTRRISKLISQLRVRGGYAGVSDEIKQIIEADDGELVPLKSAEMMVTTGGDLNKAIVWFPLEATAAALKQLVEQREIIKQNIYEVTKIADVMRGASEASETATAQNIKAQWGSLSVQRMQAEVARFARDLFRLKAEVLAKKFSMDNLVLMTGINPPPMQIKRDVAMRVQQQMQPQMPPSMGQPQQPPAQPSEEDLAILKQPSREEVEQMLRNDAVRGFRIDIESDSTIRGDLGRNQQQMTLFLSGTAQFIQAVGPLVQAEPKARGPLLEIYSAFARQFKLGKQAEDALDRLADQFRQTADQPEQTKPDPNQVKADVQMKLGQMKMEQSQREAQLKDHQMQREDQLSQAKHQRDMEALRADTEAEIVKAQLRPQQIIQPGYTGL